MKIYEFNESLIQHYTNPRAPNVIILLLIADTPKDLCVKNFIKEINSIKKEYENIFIVTSPKVSSSNFCDLTVGEVLTRVQEFLDPDPDFISKSL
jgi:hypothetical protein